jgi:hypothetical protein
MRSRGIFKSIIPFYPLKVTGVSVRAGGVSDEIPLEKK